jgi:hypothetical protein
MPVKAGNGTSYIGECFVEDVFVAVLACSPTVRKTGCSGFDVENGYRGDSAGCKIPRAMKLERCIENNYS